jgi:hypothetical protein
LVRVVRITDPPLFGEEPENRHQTAIILAELGLDFGATANTGSPITGELQLVYILTARPEDGTDPAPANSKEI